MINKFRIDIALPKQMIFISIFLFLGCKQDPILVLPKDYCIIRKHNKIYQICIEITSIDKDSLILTDCFTNKGNTNKFYLNNWNNNFESGWSQSTTKLVYINCNYVVKTSFQDDRAHQSLRFKTDSMGNIQTDSLK